MEDFSEHDDNREPESGPPAESGSEESGDGRPGITFEESRVLGCLLEKEMATPENYPLTLKALVAACNQRSNRDPVVNFDTSTTAEAMEGLRYKHLAVTVHEAGARVSKNKHILDRFFPYLQRRHFALLAVLLVRGQQTLGELRQRTERMHAFSDMESTQAALDDLIGFDPYPLVKNLPAGGGRRVPTFIHLLSGDAPSAAAPAAAILPREREEPSWRETIESDIASLREEIADLKAGMDQLRRDLGS